MLYNKYHPISIFNLLFQRSKIHCNLVDTRKENAEQVEIFGIREP